MKSAVIFSLLAVLLCVSYVRADCDDSKEDDRFFKSLGCKIKKGAEDLGDAAQPYIEKVGKVATNFGHTVANKYDDIKHKLTDDATAAAEGANPTPVHHEPTEKVPLAPLGGDAPVPAAYPAPAAPASAAQ